MDSKEKGHAGCDYCICEHCKKKDEELLKLREFVFIMVKEGATTLSKAKNLLGFNSMEEAREWYEKQLTPADEDSNYCNECGQIYYNCLCGHQ